MHTAALNNKIKKYAEASHFGYLCRMAINDIGDTGAGYLADLLKTNCALKDIR